MGEGKIEIYKAVRAHELELNKAVAAFEHAVLAPLYLLNGGGAVAFLTLIGAASGEGSSLQVDVRWSAGAISAWTLGLLAAAVTTYWFFQAQRGFAAGERIRRQEIESLVNEEAAKLVAAPTATAERLAEDARDSQARAEQSLWASVGLFIVGTALAAIAVSTG
ncbi:MAG: hypothetical protein ACRBK7_01515 [Acidimicrobiales bacterium]